MKHETVVVVEVGRGVPAEPSRLKGYTARRGRLALPRAAAIMFAGWLAVGAAFAAAGATRRPNIIFILSDDVGIVNHSTYGGGFETPHVDALAKNGLKFTHCYSTPICGPSRFQALTGRYPF